MPRLQAAWIERHGAAGVSGPTPGRRRQVTPRISHDLPVALAMAGIFLASSLSPGDTPRLDVPGLDKVVHALEYGALAWLVHRALTAPGRRPGRWSAIALAVTISTLYGATDEFHQRFVPGRESDPFDLLADALGAAVAATARAGRIGARPSQGETE